MKMKKIIATCMISVMVCGMFVGCTTNQSRVNKEKYDINSINVLKDATKKLENYDKSYIITTQLDEPSNTSEFLTVVDGNRNYSEYSVDDEGNYGTISYGSEEQVSYALSDYIDENGTYAMITGDDADNPYYTISEDYSTLVNNRTTLWMNYMLDNFTECYKYDRTSLTLFNEELNLDLYQCKLPSEYVQTILGIGSVGIYKAVLESTDDDNIKNLFQYYVDSSEYTLACSDANILVGVDDDGYLRYVGLEVGGLGTNLYYTSVVVNMDNMEVREPIDISNAPNISVLYKDVADYCAKYESVEEALQSMGNEAGLENTGISDSITNIGNEADLENTDISDSTTNIEE